MRAFAALAVRLKGPLHGFLRNVSMLAGGAGCVPEKRNSIASAPYPVNARPEKVITGPGIDQAFSDGESARTIRPRHGLRREKFDLARHSRASAHGMRLSDIEYGKCA